MSALPRLIKEPLKRAILGMQSPARDAAWNVTAEELRGVSIRWPATLQWAPARTWVEPLFHGFRSRVPVVVDEIPQRLNGAAVIEMQRGHRTFRIVINGADNPDLTHIGTDAGANEALDLEFKMQYRVGGYGREAILPGGFVSESMHSKG